MKLTPADLTEQDLENAPRVHMSRRAIICGLAAGTVIPIVSGCTTNPETGRSQFILVGEGQMAQMAASAWTEMKRETPQTSDTALIRRVDGIWRRIAVGSGRQNEPWEVAVFEDDTVNAFVMPGNKIGVYRGITDFTENDDQLATVLGHEVGHVTGRHSAERYSQQIAGQIAVVAGSIAISNSETLGEYGNELAALGGAALQFGLILPYSRRHELEADRLGVDYMYRAGYSVAEAPRLWDMMADRGTRVSEFLSTHPEPVRRASELRTYINARGYDLV